MAGLAFRAWANGLARPVTVVGTARARPPRVRTRGNRVQLTLRASSH